MSDKTYIAIDLKSFYASVECMERGLDPMTTNLVVADASRTEKTICLAVSPALKSYGIPGRPRLFEVVQKVKEVNSLRQQKAPETDRFFSSGWRTESKSRFSCRLCGGTAADGTLYENQCQDLWGVSQIYRAGRYSCLFD